MNTLTHIINPDGSLSRKPPKEGKRKKKGKIVPAKGKTRWGRIYADGREVCQLNTVAGGKEYTRRKREMWERDKGICCICDKAVSWEGTTVEHKEGRGMGGSRRDDRVEMNGVAHWDCNSRKGSKRLTPSSDVARKGE